MADPKVALVCIAKNEDNYLDEWIDYHTMLGVDGVFVYQNDWRFKPKRDHRNLTLVEFDGECRQLTAYNDFVFNRSGPFDFGIFVDADEFVCMLDGKESLKGFLSHVFDPNGGVPAVALNWRLFGDSGRERVVDGDYSLLKRFTMCQRGLNPHVKTVVNFNAMRKAKPSAARRLFSFINPHCLRMSLEGPYVRDSTLTRVVHGPFNENADIGKAVACINHYFSKTWQEFVENKKPKGKADFLYSDPKQELDMGLFGPHNVNEVECTIARDFYLSHGGL